MVYVMMQAAKVIGIFDSVDEAKILFSDVTGVALDNIKDVVSFNGDTLLLVDNYPQARIQQATYF